MGILLVTTPPAGSALFSTVFPLNEAPISQNSSWDNGGAVGVNWGNIKTNAGRAQAVSAPTPNRYDDPCAVFRSSVITAPADQYVEGVLDIDNGYVGNGGSHEAELWLRGGIIAGNARCYECSVGITTSLNAPNPPIGAYFFMVAWSGPENSFVTLWDPHGGIGVYVNQPTFPVSGDVMRARAKGNVISLLQNGTVIGSVTDNTWATGQPGMGFWPVDGAIPSAMGWKQWSFGPS